MQLGKYLQQIPPTAEAYQKNLQGLSVCMKPVRPSEEAEEEQGDPFSPQQQRAVACISSIVINHVTAYKWSLFNDLFLIQRLDSKWSTDKA